MFSFKKGRENRKLLIDFSLTDQQGKLFETKQVQRETSELFLWQHFWIIIFRESENKKRLHVLRYLQQNIAFSPGKIILFTKKSMIFQKFSRHIVKTIGSGH